MRELIELASLADEERVQYTIINTIPDLDVPSGLRQERGWGMDGPARWVEVGHGINKYPASQIIDPRRWTSDNPYEIVSERYNASSWRDGCSWQGYNYRSINWKRSTPLNPASTSHT